MKRIFYILIIIISIVSVFLSINIKLFGSQLLQQQTTEALYLISK